MKEQRMAKKVLVLTVLAVVIAGGAFAQIKPSAGVGGYFTSDFGGGAEESQGGGTVTIEMPYAGGGGFAFLD
jgi:predicted S18 family serine protease